LVIKPALGIEAKILFLEFFQKKIEAKSPTAFSAGTPITPIYLL